MLLDQIYDYMSFKEGQQPRYELLMELFHEEALIIEYTDKEFQYYSEKNIHRHIAEIEYVFSKDPEIKSKGFSVKELKNTISISGPTALVKSVYEKSYSDGIKEYNEIGLNSLQIARIEEKLLIVSMTCFEK